MLLADLAATSAAVAQTSSRTAKVELLAGALRALGPDEAVAGVAFLSGELRQRQIGVGWAALRDLPAPAAEPSLEVGEADAAFEAIGALSGPGSQAARREALAALFARATEPEHAFLRALLSGELRQGALAGVMAAAIARATGIPRAKVDRAVMLAGDARVVAAAALRDGAAALDAFRLTVGRPVGPMLASPAASIDEAFAATGEAGVEFKLDGARVQIHRDGGDVAVFSRSLDDLTARVPDVVAAALALPARHAILDGEALAWRGDGRPAPFQETASRIGSGKPGVTPVLFDVLHLDGEDLLDTPGAGRAEALAAAVPEALRTPRVVAGDVEAARAQFDAAIAAGHEGVIVKDLGAPYAAGRRGKGWLKVKPRHTLDLLVLAAEWGHGRRRGRLSNLHLGARTDAGPVMLGKTFKGLTDAMLEWQTARLLELEVERRGHVVVVRPELVVEVAFDGVQTSTRYPGGVALRFARVLRHRPDKPASEADELAAVLALHHG